MNSIELSGFDELEDLLKDMTISDAKEKKAMKLAIEPIYQEIYDNAPVGSTGKLKKYITKTVKKDGFATVGTIKMGAFYTMFQEYGTSKSKANVGFFERAVSKTEEQAIEIISKELLLG